MKRDVAILALLALSGCASPRDTLPDIANIYKDAALNNTRNPVSVIHGCCGARLDVEVAAGSVHSEADTVHFAIPARHWRDNMVFT